VLRWLWPAALVLSLLVAPWSGAADVPAGRVLAWGCGTTGPISYDYAQCAVPGTAANDVTAVAVGYAQSLALRRNGSVVAWGCGGGFNYGQCAPVPAAATTGVTAIAAGDEHSLALKDGGVVAWGCVGGVAVDAGQCTVPAAATSGVTAIAAGAWHSLALKQDGSVVAWGCGNTGGASRDYGQCSVPAAARSDVVAIAAGYAHSVALKRDGSVVAWGCASPFQDGQCSVPAAAIGGVKAIAAGFEFTLALKDDGSVIAWGCVSGVTYGECAVPAAAKTGVTAIAAGWAHAVALKQDGSAIAWGCQTSGTLNPDMGQCAVPPTASGSIKAIAAGYAQSLAILALSDQSITVGSHAPAVARYNDAFDVAATSSSGLTVTFTSSGACTNTGSTYRMTSGTGTCLVKYDQTGGTSYNAAAEVVESVAAQRAGQAINFRALPAKTLGDRDFRVAATTSSRLSVVFTTRGKCTVRQSIVHLTGAGSCTITASQPGNANYGAAAEVSRTFSIAPPPCTVPRVVGKSLAAARQAINLGHCRTGKVAFAYSSKRSGVVISQSRSPGNVVRTGARIDVAVSLGRRH
jgi:alpha-tubulin suppressor-like RCC1 family protein